MGNGRLERDRRGRSPRRYAPRRPYPAPAPRRPCRSVRQAFENSARRALDEQITPPGAPALCPLRRGAEHRLDPDPSAARGAGPVGREASEQASQAIWHARPTAGPDSMSLAEIHEVDRVAFARGASLPPPAREPGPCRGVRSRTAGGAAAGARGAGASGGRLSDLLRRRSSRRSGEPLGSANGARPSRRDQEAEDQEVDQDRDAAWTPSVSTGPRTHRPSARQVVRRDRPRRRSRTRP